MFKTAISAIFAITQIKPADSLSVPVTRVEGIEPVTRTQKLLSEHRKQSTSSFLSVNPGMQIALEN